MSSEETASEESSGVHRRRRGREPLLRAPSVSEQARLACLKGDLVKVQSLIEGGSVTRDEVFSDGWTPLMVVSNGAHPHVLSFLIDNGADPNLSRQDGFCPLMAAITSSKSDRTLVLEVVELLLKAGAEVNIQDGEGRTPLSYAAERGLADVIKILLRTNADPNVADKLGRKPSDIAISKSHREVADALVKSSTEKLIHPPEEEITEHDVKTENYNSSNLCKKNVDDEACHISESLKGEQDVANGGSKNVKDCNTQELICNEASPVRNIPALPVPNNANSNEDKADNLRHLNNGNGESDAANREQVPNAGKGVNHGRQKAFIGIGIAFGIGILVFCARVYFSKI